METWLMVYLVLTAVVVFIFRNYPVFKGAMLGVFAGLMMVFLYPLMPSVVKGIVVTAKGIDLTLTLSTALLTRETLNQWMGWLIIFFPVSVFFLAYLHHLPMDFYTLLGSVLAFTLCYSTVFSGTTIFQSIWMLILLNLLVSPIVFLVMFGFGWAIRGWRYIMAVLSLASAVNDTK